MGHLGRHGPRLGEQRRRRQTTGRISPTAVTVARRDWGAPGRLAVFAAFAAGGASPRGASVCLVGAQQWRGGGAGDRAPVGLRARTDDVPDGEGGRPRFSFGSRPPGPTLATPTR